jgi:hypothetical protein
VAWQARMPAEEYRRVLEVFGLSLEEGGRVFGWSSRQAHRYASGEAPIPAPNRKLLRTTLRLTSGGGAGSLGVILQEIRNL